MTISAVLDSAGRRRSPATLPGFHAGRPPRNKGMRYPADPPTVEEIIAVMRNAGDNRHGWRLRALIVVLWRGGLRIQEALALAEPDLDPRRGSLLVRNGKGGRRREIGMDAWGWEQLRPWLTSRRDLPEVPGNQLSGLTRGRRPQVRRAKSPVPALTAIYPSLRAFVGQRDIATLCPVACYRVRYGSKTVADLGTGSYSATGTQTAD